MRVPRSSRSATNGSRRSRGWPLSSRIWSAPEKAGQGYHRLASWGPRAPLSTSRRTSSAKTFEQPRARIFEREAYKPRSVHIAVSEYYVNVVHARVHQCLHATSFHDRAPESAEERCQRPSSDGARSATTGARAFRRGLRCLVRRRRGEGGEEVGGGGVAREQRVVPLGPLRRGARPRARPPSLGS